jgi:cytochrome c556
LNFSRSRFKLNHRSSTKEGIFMSIQKPLVLALASLTLLLSSGVQASNLKPEEMIKFRKASYNFMAWNMGKIKNNLEGEFNKDAVINAASAIAAVANSGMGALYAPGTDKNVGNEKTRLKADFFKEPEKVREIAINFNKQANELAKVAAGGDAIAIQAQFGKLGESCKSCHDRYRAK